MPSNKIKTEKNLINSFYTPHQLTFNFLYFFLFSFFFLFVILLNILPVNNLLFRDILIQLNIFKINNIFFILILIVYTCL